MRPVRCGCNATGRSIGAGRTTRQISRRLRRALEHRDRMCAVPGCGATRGLHAHHIRHWEDGGPTDLHNLVLLCPYHHRLHHRGAITITGPADQLVVTDSAGQQLTQVTGPTTNPPPTRCPAMPGADRRTRRLVVVPTLPPTTTTHKQLTSFQLGRRRFRSRCPLLSRPHQDPR